MAADNTVSVRIAGIDYAGWLAVSITAGIDRMSRSFEVGVTAAMPGAAVSAMVRRIRAGQAVEVRIGADLVMTGWIDARPISYDDRSITASIRGRSKTADLVDCSAIYSPGQWRGLSVERIASALASSYSVSVHAQIETVATVAEHQIEQGETVQESLDRLLSPRGLLATDDAVGNLVLIDVGSSRADDALELGVNVRSASADLDNKDRFANYVVRGQSSTGADAASPAAGYGAAGRATDADIGRNRTLLIKQSGQADGTTVQERATYERDHRSARSEVTQYVVQGWRQSTGALWQPNQMVHVRDALIGWDEAMLITEVTWALGAEGPQTTLSVGPVAGWITPAVVHRLKKQKKVTYVE